MNICYFYCTLLRQAEFPNYPKFCISEIGSVPFISDNRGSTVYVIVLTWKLEEIGLLLNFESTGIVITLRNRVTKVII